MERENQLMLQKMSYIMSKNGLDNHNDVQARSLNADLRKRELQTIMGQNQVCHTFLVHVNQSRHCCPGNSSPHPSSKGIL